MTDLSDFGGGIDRTAGTSDETGESVGRDYPRGRCRALTTAGQRCRGHPAVSNDSYCSWHEQTEPVATIDDGPVSLIEATTRTLWREFENERVCQAVAAVTRGEQS